MMMKSLKTYPENCVACHVCESACSNLYFKVDDPEKSRIRITETDSQPRMNACTQCGICVQSCPTLALSINSQGVVMVNQALCIGCYMCIAACPTGSMFRTIGAITPFKCVACGVCTKTCPADAIRIEENKES
jgi:Fe-S-cluster-containing hydrogenase component 2